MKDNKNIRIILIIIIITIVGALIYILTTNKKDENIVPKTNQTKEVDTKITPDAALKAVTEEGVEYTTTRFVVDKIINHNIHGKVYPIYEIENETNAKIATYYVDVYTADIRFIEVQENT